MRIAPAKLCVYCHVFLHLLYRAHKNGISDLGVVGVLALEVYPRYAAAAFSEGEASSLSSADAPGLSNKGEE